MINLLAIPSYSLFGLYDGVANVFIMISEDDYKIISFLREVGLQKAICSNQKKSVSTLLHTYNAVGLLTESGSIRERTLYSDHSVESLSAYASQRALNRKLTIELTNRCNLRCKYCRYTINESDQLKSQKKHGNNDIKKEIATRAIDIFLEKYVNSLTQIPNHLQKIFLAECPPTISFYGGEVLLCKSLFKELVVYIEQKTADLSISPILSITTNGTLMDEEIIDFLVAHNIFISISLDGPPEENDKNRIYANGKGSGKTVLSAIETINRKYPYYLSEKGAFQAVDAPNYNHRKVLDFFSSMQGESKKFGGVSLFRLLDFMDFSSDKDQSDKIDNQNSTSVASDTSNIDLFIKNLSSTIEKIEEQEAEETIISIINNLPRIKDNFEIAARMRIQLDETPRKESPYFNSCYIGVGNKFVAADGNLHMCERTDFSIPIGNVEAWIDETKIHDLYKEYLMIMNRESCKHCWAGIFCPLCIGQLVDKGKIRTPSRAECNSIRNTANTGLHMLMLLATSFPKSYAALKTMFSQGETMTIDEFLSKHT